MPVTSCIILLNLPQAGIAITHVNHCCSVISLPLVRLPVVFKVLISACSITGSVGRPAHKRSLLLTTWRPRIQWDAYLQAWTSAANISTHILYSDCAQMQLGKRACLKEIEGAIPNYHNVALL